MKRTVLVMMMLALGCSLSFAAGSRQQSAGSAGQTTVVLYTWWADAEQAMGEALVADFEKANPTITVEQNYISYNDYHSKINTMIASGTTPDLMFLNEYLINELGEKGVIEDLYPFYFMADT